MAFVRSSVTSRNAFELSGTAKLSFTEDFAMSEVSLLSFDQRSVPLSETPYGMWW